MKIIERMQEAVQNYKIVSAELNYKRASISCLFEIPGYAVNFHSHCDKPEVSVWEITRDFKDKSMEFEIVGYRFTILQGGAYSHEDQRMICDKLNEIIDSDSEGRDEKKQANELEAQIADDYCDGDQCE